MSSPQSRPPLGLRCPQGRPRRRTSRLWLVALCCLSLVPPLSLAWAGPDEGQLKAAVIYNLIKFVEWPAGSLAPSGAPLLLGVPEADPLAEALMRLQGKTVQGRPLAIQKTSQLDQLKKCQVVVLADSGQARALLSNFKGLPILTITDGLGNFVSLGGVINLVEEEGKLRFQVNLEAAGRARLSINSQLLKLAKIVGDR